MATLHIMVDIPTTGLLDIEELKQRVTTYANSLIARQHTRQHKRDYAESAYISDRIKALETGFKCEEYTSDDYKKELQELKAQRHT